MHDMIRKMCMVRYFGLLLLFGMLCGCESHSTINDLIENGTDSVTDSESVEANGTDTDTTTDSDTNTDDTEVVVVHNVPSCMDNGGLERMPSECEATVSINTPSQMINSTYARIDGSSIGVTLPMWYEVFDHSDRMIDFGAFEAGEPWFFVVRHLSGGTNTIVVYAASDAEHITTETLTLRVNDAADSPVRPRPYPAEVWWGGTADNAQLKDNPEGWPFVRNHADAFFYHTAAWPEEMNATMESLVAQLRPIGTKFIAELGGQTAIDTGWSQWMHASWGAGSDGWVINRYNTTGLILSEVTHAFHPGIRDFVAANPAMRESEIIALMASYWKDYFLMNYSVFPHLKHAHTHSPLWWNWGDYKALGGDLRDDDYVFSLNGREYNFDYADIMIALREIGNEIPGHREWAFYSDFPYYAMISQEGAPYDGAHVMEKTYAYEQWLREAEARHTMILIEDPTDQCLDLDAMHEKFAVNGFEALKLYQQGRGRAHRYELESWYNCDGVGWVPSRVTPETEPYTYTWLVREVIQFIKGIKTADGALETLTLSSVQNSEGTFFVLENTGGSLCMPNLQVFEEGESSIEIKWFDADNRDITNMITGDEGWVFTDLLEPGQSTTIRMEVSGAVDTADKTVRIEAFWNPQDPTGLVRARFVQQL